MNSLTHGFDEIKDDQLRLSDSSIGKAPHYRHKAALKKLCDERKTKSGREMAWALYDCAVQNWKQRRPQNNPSKQNWRFKAIQEFDQKNASPEVTFERCLAKAAGDDWANQVPTCAGIFSSKADTRRSIDLVQRNYDGRYDLIELKIASDTPLYAALEVLDYGVLYAFCRTHASELEYASGYSEILDAQKIGLRVLAPQDYYQLPSGLASLGWLDETMNAAAEELAAIIGTEFRMDFRFESFDSGFSWDSELHRSDPLLAGQYALQAVEARRAFETEKNA